MTLILASGSPRRKELLSKITTDFDVVVSDVDETTPPSMKGPEVVEVLAIRKANEVAKEYPDELVIGSDTIVVLNDEIMGKPKDEADAKRMLEQLSGTTHEVLTAVHLTKGQQKATQVVTTKVTLFELTPEEIDAYIATKEPMDKAGSYGIQGKGALLVKKIDGDFYSVAGFPVSVVARMLNEIQ